MDEEWVQVYTCAKMVLPELGGEVIMKYYWDGDGFLSFILPDGKCLTNSDCKKDHVWEIWSSFEAYKNF
jgi:hypothetical protein